MEGNHLPLFPVNMNSHLSFILGGARSGKSSYAEDIARQSTRPVLYIATCRTHGIDEEMKARIAQHRNNRPSEWKTVENRFDLPALIREFPEHTLLLDCLTLWLGHQTEALPDETAILALLRESWETLRTQNAHAIVVSNEIGLGVVPEYAAVRAFRDLCGRANQLTARMADETTLMVAGLPWKLKRK